MLNTWAESLRFFIQLLEFGRRRDFYLITGWFYDTGYVVERYRLYIDESGDHTYKQITSPDRRYLCLMGVIVEAEHYRSSFHPAFENIKQKNFPHDPDDPLILHRSNIINRKGLFRVLRDPDKEKDFNKDFLQLVSQQVYLLIAVVIDKKFHKDKYGAAAFHPYIFCLTVMLERYAGFLNYSAAKGDVMSESRGGTEDKVLKDAYSRVWNKGTYYRRASFFQHGLSSKELKLKPKKANIAGIQFADLLAHPIKQDILLEYGKIASITGTFGHKICIAAKKKYNRQFNQGRIKGYGRIFLG